MTRRDVLKLVAWGAVSLGSMVPSSLDEVEANIRKDANKNARIRKPFPVPDEQVRQGVTKNLYSGRLSFLNVHSKEFINVQYINRKGLFDPNACRKLYHLFRCHSTGREVPIHPELFLLLDAVRHRLGARERAYHLFSGYRTPSYNRLLARRDCHVAKNSFHIRGMAADVALEGVRLADIARVAKRLNLGGVGKYGDFVHLDVGPVRCW